METATRKIIKLKSRGDNNNWLEYVEPNKYKLISGLDTYRIGFDPTPSNIIFVDPPGGPYLEKGAYVEEMKACIDSITQEDGNIIITFK